MKLLEHVPHELIQLNVKKSQAYVSHRTHTKRNMLFTVPHTRILMLQVLILQGFFLFLFFVLAMDLLTRADTKCSKQGNALFQFSVLSKCRKRTEIL